MLITVNSIPLSVRFVYSGLVTECHFTDRNGVAKEVRSQDLPSVYVGKVKRHKNDPENRIVARKFAFKNAIKSLSKEDRKAVWAQYLAIARYTTQTKSPMYHKKGNPSPLVAFTPEGEFGIEFEKVNANDSTFVFCYVQKRTEDGEWEPMFENHAECCPLDHFDGIFGRKLALRRALTELSKESRSAIWKSYLSCTRANLRKAPSEDSIFA